MSKRIKVLITGTIELPDAAEVIRFRDEEGVENDHIKFNGRIFRPDIAWMEYFSKAIMQERFPGVAGGMGWESIDDETYNDHFVCCDDEWYLEESAPNSP